MEAAALQDEFEVAIRDDRMLLGNYGNVMVTLALGPSNLHGIDEAYDLNGRLRARYPDGYAQLIIASGGAGMPSAEARSRYQQISREFQSSLICQAMVFEGDGVWAASMRMVARTMMLALQGSLPRQMFGGVPEAAAWVARQAGPRAHFDAASLVNSVQTLRPR